MDITQTGQYRKADLIMCLYCQFSTTDHISDGTVLKVSKAKKKKTTFYMINLIL